MNKHAAPADDWSSLREAEAVVETVREPLLVLGADLTVEKANPAFLRHFRTSASEAIGRSLFELDDGAWDAPLLRKLLETLIPQHRTIEDFEIVHRFPRLGRRTVLINASEVEHEGEGYAKILIAFEDVTEARRAERAMRRAHVELERSNRELEEFAHAASHDLQEPLRKIHAFVDRLVGVLPESALDERARLYVDRVQDAVTRMQQRIDDLLQLARVSRTPPRLTSVDLGKVVAEVIGDLDLDAAAVRIDELPTVEADATRMGQLFQNLLHNAAKYRRADVPLEVRVTSQAAASPEGDDRPWVRVSVEDNGIGFDPQYAERIFGAFQRLHGRSEYEGSGVGLSVCRRIVEQHDGRIAAIGRPGQGARFDVDLPMVAASPEER